VVYAFEGVFEASQTGFLAVDFSAVSDVQDLYYTSLVVYFVDDAMIADPNSPIVSTAQFSAARRPGLLGKAVYLANHSFIDRIWKSGYALLHLPL
jgi:hypothetical protein